MDLAMLAENVRSLALLLPFAFAAACTDSARMTAPPVQTPAVIATDQPSPLTSLTCVASVQERTVACASPAAGTSGGATRDVILGGQNQYVTLTSSNIRILADTFVFDVTVQNLIPQPIGTSDGATADTAGVRVFFNSGPTSTTGGSVRVANPDGVATFTASAQPYFRYNGLLYQNGVSAPRTWKLQLTPEVTNFTFTVYLSAAVLYPNGYISGVPYVLALDPGESRALTGLAYTSVGTPLPSETIAWSSSAPGTAAVNGTQVTAGNSRGFATLTATAGIKPAVYPTAVSVCQSTTVTNGTTLPSSIASSDCFSSFGDSTGRPTTDYYADLYRVTLTAGQTITVTMASGDNLDTYLLLAEDRIGQLVADNDDDDEGVLGVGSRLVYTATTSGVYVIEASTFAKFDTGNYTLHVTIN